ncbi:MAG TPA: NADPH-dependent F420 reductase [Ramlibacter sp.]|nr:NADPH-dependent F420 reductase [Ramlibacter sp.]
MKITVIGSGNMGSAFVKQLRAAGHQVRVTGRNLAKATELARQNPGVEAIALPGAAEGADAIIVATPYEAAADSLRSLGDLNGKVVLDITNPLTPDYMGLTVGHDTSASEQIAKAVPGAQVVKGFNTLFAQVLAAGPDFGNGRKATVFLASDSDRAKQTARALAESMGFETMDAGPLKNARYLEPVAGLNIYFGYGAGLGTAVAPAWLRKS